MCKYWLHANSAGVRIYNFLCEHLGKEVLVLCASECLERDLGGKLFQRGFLLVPLNVKFHTLTAFLHMSSVCVEFGFRHVLIFRVEFEVSILLITTVLVELQIVIAVVIDRSLDI